MDRISGKMIYNDKKISNYEFLREYLLEHPAQKIGICAALSPSEFRNLPGDPKIVTIREIYTDKVFWLLEE